MMIVGGVRALGIALAVVREAALGIVQVVVQVIALLRVVEIARVACLVDNYGASPFV